jgi:hypothetical protein
LLGSWPDSIGLPVCCRISIMPFFLNYLSGSIHKEMEPSLERSFLRSSLTFVWYSIISKHLCLGAPLSCISAKKVAGFRASSVVKLGHPFLAREPHTLGSWNLSASIHLLVWDCSNLMGSANN